MVYDFKKEERPYYRPSKKPLILDLSPMKYLAVFGKGDPNVIGGDYKQSLNLLYSVAYKIKMSKRGDHQIKDYFDFVVPPLEGFWWQLDHKTMDYKRKDLFQFISCLRVPNFVTSEVLEWAISEVAKTKSGDFDRIKLITISEGKCAQIMHQGSYNTEPSTIDKLTNFVLENNFKLDYSPTRHHHEIYLSNPQRTKEQNLKTIIRIPIK